MVVGTTAMRNILAGAYGSAATYAALYTTATGSTPPTQTAGTEVSGGSPAYARKALAGGSWTTGSSGAITVTVTFDVPAGTTVVAAGVHSALTAGTFYDGGSVTSQAFASQGTYALTITFTQT